MSLFSRLFSQLYPNQPGEKATEGEVLVREPIKHNNVFLNAYEKWLYNEMHHGLLNDLNEKRAQRKEQSAEKVNYFEVQNNAYRGFYFYGESAENRNDYNYLVHYFVIKLLNQGYYLTNAIREVTEEERGLISIEQFYLKPSLKFRRKTPYVQLFGNIEIEHKIENEETKMIKLLSTVYSDQHYQRPFEFEHLLDELFLF